MILADTPQAYYRMNESSGTVANDSSGNSYNATLAGVSAYAQTGAITGDSDTSMSFTASGGLTLPTNLQYYTWTAFSLEFWVQLGSTWYYVAVTTNNSGTTTLYLNGTATSSSNPGTVFIDALFDAAGSLTAAAGLDEIALYNYTISSSQVLHHYTIAAPAVISSYTQYNLNVYKEQMVLVYDQYGNFVDSVRDAPVLSGFKESINAVTGSLKVVLPRKFEQIDLPGQANSHGIMQQGYVWKYYLFGPGLPSSGLLRYSGQVDEYAPEIAESGQETIAVTLTPQGSAIADSGLGTTLSFGTAGQSGTYVDPIAQFNYWFQNVDPVTGKAYCNPLTLDSGNPSSSGVTTQFTYTNQTIKSIFDNVILMLPANYFYRTNPDNTVTLNQTPLTAQHVLQVGVHIANPQYSQSWIQTQTAVFFLGGNDSNGNPVTAIARGVDLETIGERLYLHNESRVTDQATANALAQGDLNYYDQPMLRTKIRVPDYRGPNPSIGYDIESIKVGDSIQIQDNTYNGASSTWDNAKWGSGIWDQSPGPALNTVGVVTALNYGFYYVDLELGLPQPSIARAVSQIQQKLADFTLL